MRKKLRLMAPLLSLLVTVSTILASPRAANAKKTTPLQGNIRIYGHGDRNSNRSMNGTINDNSLAGSANADDSLSGNATNNGARLRLDRTQLGKMFPSLDKQKMYALQTNRTKLPGDLSDQELKELQDYDVIVMQDRSSSMGEDERILGRHGLGFRKMSRWDWCREEAHDFTRQTSALPDWAFTLVLFSSQYDVFPRVSLMQLPRIYDRSGIFIGTRLATPLGEQISQFFARRAMGSKRPLLIAVITDGKPQDDENLRDLLIQTTYQMRDPAEIRIVFLQIGNDDDGSKKLYKLDRKLMRKGARHDIVTVKPFPEVLNLGLSRALVATLEGR